MDSRTFERTRTFDRIRLSAVPRDEHPHVNTDVLLAGLYRRGLHMVTGADAAEWAAALATVVAGRGLSVMVLAPSYDDARPFIDAAARTNTPTHGPGSLKVTMPHGRDASDSAAHLFFAAPALGIDLFIVADRGRTQELLDDAGIVRPDSPDPTIRDPEVSMMCAASSCSGAVVIVDPSGDPGDLDDPATHLRDVALRATSPQRAVVVADTRGRRSPTGKMVMTAKPGTRTLVGQFVTGELTDLGPELDAAFVPDSP